MSAFFIGKLQKLIYLLLFIRDGSDQTLTYSLPLYMIWKMKKYLDNKN